MKFKHRRILAGIISMAEANRELRAKPHRRIVYPDDKPLCPDHGCFMYQHGTAGGVVTWSCPAAGCRQHVHKTSGVRRLPAQPGSATASGVENQHS